MLVNNAGAGVILPLADTTADRITKIFSVNVFGSSLLTAAALPHMVVGKGTTVCANRMNTRSEGHAPVDH